MNDKKIETILQLVRDPQLMQQMDSICHNWEVVASRLQLIEEEREKGLNNDDGVEVAPLFCRMERVYSQLLSLVGMPQAVLLRSVMERLRPLADDKRMDREATRLMDPKEQQPMLVPPSIWEKMLDMKSQNQEEAKKLTSELYAKNILPHMDGEQLTETFQLLAGNKEGEEDAEVQMDGLFGDLADLGLNIHMAAQEARQAMGVGLMAGHLWMQSVCRQLDIRQKDAEELYDKFEEAKQELMDSDGWKEYWDEHLTHLQMHGKQADELRKDAEEVEAWLIDRHHYLYNKWNEGPRAFGEALKAELMDDEQMLLLLFYLAKKDMLYLESAPAQERRQKMEQNVLEAAMKLHELVDENYYCQYEMMWQTIVKGKHTSALLLDCNSSKYNNGFSMICLCKIIGHLHREHHLFGNHSPEDMGKFLGDKYSRETFSNYIKKRQIMLTSLSIKEIEDAVGVPGKPAEE